MDPDQGYESVAYFVLVRGPLGVGKTTVCQQLARELPAEYISIDRVLEDHGLWESGALDEFLLANRFVVERAAASLTRGKPVVVDGNFYWKAQIDQLVDRLRYPHYLFTLRAPLEVCIDRDRGRPHPHGPQSVREVYDKSLSFEIGRSIDATGDLDSVVTAIRAQLP